MSKKVSLQDRKRTKDLMDDEVIQDKHEQLLELKELQEAPAEEVFTLAPEPIEVTKQHATTSQHFGEARQLADKLQQFFEGLNANSTNNRLAMSRQEQHDCLMDELRVEIGNKAERLLADGTPKKRVLMICQALIDDVRVMLAQQGVRLNHLYIKKPRQARM